MSYLLALMIALQSFVAVADIHPITLDQDIHQNEHAVSEAEPVHHVDNGGDKHPDCHHGHCHHASVVFVVKEQANAIISSPNNKFSRLAQTSASLLLSPDLRPPIFSLS